MEVRQTEDKAELAYRCFVDTCRSPATRDIYIRALSFFMSYLKLPPRAYNKLLDKDPKIIQTDICDFITHLRRRGIASASISTYVSAIARFYVINDLTTLNWKKIKSFMGEHEKAEKLDQQVKAKEEIERELEEEEVF